jgi:hypothetical protein
MGEILGLLQQLDAAGGSPRWIWKPGVAGKLPHILKRHRSHQQAAHGADSREDAPFFSFSMP